MLYAEGRDPEDLVGEAQLKAIRNLPSVQYLVEHAEIYQQDLTQCLEVAVRMESQDVVKLLVRHGANAFEPKVIRWVLLEHKAMLPYLLEPLR